MRIPWQILSYLFLLAFLAGCRGETTYTPKPRAYPKVVFPEKEFQTFEQGDCPLQFLFPGYAEINKQEQSSSRLPVHPCWFNVYYPEFDARIHCNYFQIDDRADFDELLSDTYRIANQINLRSQYMDELRVMNPHGVSGIVLEFTGPAASPMQFYLTDSTRHFFRGALYFNTQAKPDSLAPVTEFIKEDIATLINSFQWVE